MAELLKGPFTLAEYHRLGDRGLFHEDDRVELLDGQVVPMTPIGDEHVSAVIRLTRLLGAAAWPETALSIQNPLILTDRSEPQPDIVVLSRPSLRGAWLPTAAEALLVVEVADASLKHDRDRKIPLYAASGVPEMWLVNLPSQALHIFTAPRPGGYVDLHVARRGETVSPIRSPGLIISVDDILG